MKKLLFFAAVVTAVNLPAEVFVWQGDAQSSMLDMANYTVGGKTAERLPTSSDTVNLPANSSATVDDDSVARIGAVLRISPASGSVLNVSISTNAVMSCTIAGSSTSVAYGRLVKSGAGVLTLSSANGHSSSRVYLDCFTSLSITEGSVVLPQGSSALTTSKSYQLGTCTVAEGCTLWLPDTCATWMTTLNGAGIVTNTASGTLRLNGSGAKGAFSGAIGGANIAMEVYYGSIDLTGESMSTKNFIVSGGIVGTSRFGGPSSPLGQNLTVYVKGDGGTFRYLGSALETVEKEFSIYSANNGAMPFTVDGGAYGGLTFTGDWSPYNNKSNPARMRRIVVTGSNEVECVAANRITTDTAPDDGTNYSFSVTKKGSGVWRFANNAGRTFTGSVAVDEGTLRFDSIDETNVVCSLGRARDLYGDLEGVKDGQPLPYAIRLGSATAEGKFEYTGTGFAQTKTRAVGLAGDARIVHNGTAGFIRLLSGISAVTAGAKTLTLDGDGTVDCEVANVSDGSGVVSVVKDGDGIWALTGEQSFSGSLRVKKGTLYLRNPDHYNWFRFVIRENLGSAETRLYELGLFDSEEHRVALTPVTVYDTDKGSLQYGEAALWRSVSTHSSGPFSCLFDGIAGSTYVRFQGSRPQTGSESTWIYIAMRVPADANVVAFDYAPYVGNATSAYQDAGLKSFVMQGSLDGMEWIDLYEESEATKTSNAKWHYTGNSVSAGGLNAGQAFDTTIPVADRAANFLGNASSVSVDSGATLVLQGDVSLSRLTVASAGAGTVVGGALAAGGTLDIVGDIPTGVVDFPLAFSGVSGLENILSWDITVNGEANSFVKLVMSGGQLKMKPTRGLIVIMR